MRFFQGGSILLNIETFKISKTIFFSSFGYAENNDGFYFVHKCM